MSESEGSLVVGEETEGELGSGGKRRESGVHPRTLTERMVRLLEKVSLYDYLTIREVELLYANQTHAYRVLKFLEKQGLLKIFPTCMRPKAAYCLSSRGYRLLARAGRLEVPGRFRPDAYQVHLFSHKTACARAGIILESHPMVRGFLPEKPLWAGRKGRGRKVCDGEFSIVAPGRNRPIRVGLEVELTLKNSEKLEDSFRDLKARQELDAVWWICGDRNLLRILAREIRDRRWLAPQSHLLTTLEELVAHKHRASLEDPDGGTYSLDPDRPRVPVPERACPEPVEETDREDGDGSEDDPEPGPYRPESDDEEEEEPVPLPSLPAARQLEALLPSPGSVQPSPAKPEYVEIELSDVLATCGRLFREIRDALPGLLFLGFICGLAWIGKQLVIHYFWR